MYHKPVLLEESIAGLNIRPGGVYVDVTFGSGGHSRAILREVTEGKLYAFDRDADAIQNMIQDDRFTLIHQNYRYLKNFLNYHGIRFIDGLIADLGISSWQIDRPERGFSTRFDDALDMRMDREQHSTATDIVNTYTLDQLTTIFRQYGEIINSRTLASEIIEARQAGAIDTTGKLREIADKCAPRGKENQYHARVFQAIRIEVNEELDSLKDMLRQAGEMLNADGRLVVISYHSLEDRLVKNFMRSGNFNGVQEKDFFGNTIAPLKPVNRKAIVAGEKEVEANSRARSAKLRIAERV